MALDRSFSSSSYGSFPDLNRTFPLQEMTKNEITRSRRDSEYDQQDCALAPGMMRAVENSSNMSRVELERTLMERMMLRKDLRLRSIQEKLSDMELAFTEFKELKALELSELKEQIEELNSELVTREDELDGLLAVPGLPTYLATIRGLQASLAAFFNFFSWTYQMFLFVSCVVPYRSFQLLCSRVQDCLLYTRYALLRLRQMAGRQSSQTAGRLDNLNNKAIEELDSAERRRKKKAFYR